MDILINDLSIFVAPRYNSTSRKLITTLPFIITTHFLPVGHRLLQGDPVNPIEQEELAIAKKLEIKIKKKLK
jgi:hypothetical protein